MSWLILIPIAALVAFCWWPRHPTTAPLPPVTDTARGLADRTRSERLSAPFDWDGDDAA